MSHQSDDSLQGKGLQDIPGSALQEGLTDLLARNSSVCDSEYGTRVDDGALVFHFFPPGAAENPGADWADWYVFRDRLEKAALDHFVISTIDAGYASELHSFFVILKPPPMVPDRVALIESFFAALEGGTRTASGSPP